MGYAHVDYEKQCRMLTVRSRAYEKEANTLTEWFCELDTQLRGSGTLNV